MRKWITGGVLQVANIPADGSDANVARCMLVPGFALGFLIRELKYIQHGATFTASDFWASGLGKPDARFLVGPPFDSRTNWEIVIAHPQIFSVHTLSAQILSVVPYISATIASSLHQALKALFVGLSTRLF